MLILRQLFIFVGLTLMSHVNAEDVFTSSFEEEVSGKVTTKCQFDLTYTNNKIEESKVRCGKINKATTVNDFIYETDTLHQISIKLKISKKGNGKIISSSIKIGMGSLN